jgi:hypothetical protein
MAEATETRVVAQCSFCTKPSTEVRKLIAGPGLYICNECVGLCGLILEDETPEPGRAHLAPWEVEQPLQQVLDLLPKVAAASSQAEENLGHWVRRARGLGATWARIGESLGMTRQSAWERFSGEG